MRLDDCLFERPITVPGLPIGLALDARWYPEPPPRLWSAGPSASLIVAIETIPPGCPLLFGFWVLSPAATRINFRSQGHPELSCANIQGRKLSLQVPAPLPGKYGFGRVDLEVDRCGSPFQLGLSGDERCLGICLVEVVVQTEMERVKAHTVLEKVDHQPA